MKKITCFFIIFLYLFYSFLSVPKAYADWATPIVKTVQKSFVYNGIQYTVRISDTISSSKATTLLRSVANGSLSKVAIPLRFLGWVGVVSGVGYLIYDLTSIKDQVMQNYDPLASYPTLSNPLYCYILAYEYGRAYGSPNAGSAVWHGGGLSYTGGSAGVGTFYQYFSRLWGYNGIHVAPLSQATGYSLQLPQIKAVKYVVYPYSSGNVPLSWAQTACQAPLTYVSPMPSDQQIRDWVNQNPLPFANLNPVLSPTKPSDAVEIRDYPDITAEVDSAPQPSQESQPNPVEQPIPQPSNPDNYINPSVPGLPAFDTKFDVPEKKDISTLLDRWLSAIPFVGLLSNLGISGSGSCSVSVQTPFQKTGVMNFCQYDDVFRTIGSFIFVFASIYAVYIIFKRSD